MVKRKIKETYTEYDDDGKIIAVTVTETEEEDDGAYGWTYTTTPAYIASPAVATYADSTISPREGA